jgi:hypothetical protein
LIDGFPVTSSCGQNLFSIAKSMSSSSPFDPLRSRAAQAVNTSREQRVLAGLEHSELAIRVVEDGIRERDPLADEATVKRLLFERIELMRRMQNRTLSEQ